MAITSLIERFRGRVNKDSTATFIRLVKVVASFDKARSWLTPLPEMPTEEKIQAALRGPQRPAGRSAAASPS
jgi:transcription initiation factor TFIIF subunit alpha